MSLKNINILITGGLGFIGSNLAIKLVKLGAKVTLLDSLIPEYGGNLKNISGYERKLAINISDLRDKYSINQIVKRQDILFNLAGQTSHQDSMINPLIDLDINSKSQLILLEACKNNNKNIHIVYASTRQIYGKPVYLPVNEKHPVNPIDINGINKLSAENFHSLYNIIYGIKCSILRLTNTYGPRMRIKDARQTFLGIWIKNLLIGKPIEVFGDGCQLRDFTFIDDVLNALILSATNKETIGKIFNIGGDEVISLNKLAELMIKVNGTGTYKNIDFPTDRKKIDIGDYYSDYSLFNKCTNYYPRVKLIDGLTKTLNYFSKYLKYYET